MAIRSCRPLPVSLSLLVLALSGCGTALHGEDAPALGSRESEIRIANSLTTDALVLNAISANPESNGLLATWPLQALFDPATGHANTRRRLHDPDAQRFMSYLVGCALSDTQSLTWYDPRPPTPGVRQWVGQAGLCPEWKNSAPSPGCLQRVSACLLARNNALGHRVELSMRGEHPHSVTGTNVFTLETKTRPADHDPVTALKFDSFETCGLGESGPQRDCGWKPDGIGICDASGTALVGAGAPTSCSGPAPVLGSSGGQVVLRVCDGVLGCDHASTRNLGEATGSCSGSAPVPVVSFSCTPGQYFSVMTAPWSSTTAHPSATVASSPASVVRYALSERQVYGVREGAFYGNLFAPMSGTGYNPALAQGVNVDVVQVDGRGGYEVEGDDVQVRGSIYRNMYSCFDPAWSTGGAYASSRLCAMPNTNPSLGVNCAATVTGACFNSLAPPSPGRCAVLDGPLTPADGDYEQCKDPMGVTWMFPVTTFLHTACDTMPNADGSKPPCAQR
ncbi:hypothetical protein HPC49_38910 [Pyxidicoccus fallax]|uniref:Lipoprotein n=1 Tax=Pyxidicoccus fallax TaxID=394095 RepID=A0A848LHZ6_9BACT|nr:hypothetical protein [Pyxidicoccus fallax]NMO16848.1 hypothetical protein [Pyxidicoccus fallax]NPC84170.1 hypothetical protein [Pyxidicoccus fallax]